MDQETFRTPTGMLREAIKAVPAVKYALGVGGIIAVVALIASFKIDFRIAIFGTIIMFVLMTVLVMFASLAGQNKASFKIPMLVFTWFSLLLTMATAFALFTSVFAGWPRLRRIVELPDNQKQLEVQPPPARQPESKPIATEVLGKVPQSDSTSSQHPIAAVEPKASIKVESSPPPTRPPVKNDGEARRLEGIADDQLREAISMKACLMENCHNLELPQEREAVEIKIEYTTESARHWWREALKWGGTPETEARIKAKINSHGFTCHDDNKPCEDDGVADSYYFVGSHVYRARLLN